MEEDKITINLRVAGDVFNLTIRRSEEIYYRDAVKKIENQLNFFRNRFGESIADKQMKMVALNLAFNLVKKEEAQDDSPIFERLDSLDKQLVDLLKI